MHTPALIHQIEQLLKEGRLSRRKIAERLHVSMATVSAVAKGTRRHDDGSERLLKIQPVGKPRRCPSCKAMVQMPCRLCQTRELIAGGHVPSPMPDIPEPIGLDLRPEHQAGYAEVRRWRREALRLGIITKPKYDED